MKTTFQKAERTALRISQKLGSPDWFLGVGVEVDAREGFVLSLRVAPGFGSRVQALTPRFNGVKVRVDERQMARAARRAASS